MAMWGAPERQDDHAERAVRAALAMLRVQQELDARWRARLARGTAVGIGVNSGEALVGNVGSMLKFKYGPQGDTVNVASRIQGMTKYLKCPLLVSRDTLDSANKTVRSPLTHRRVVKVRLTGVERERDLYEVADPERSATSHFTASEKALGAPEKRDFAEAAQRARELLRKNPADGPL